MHRLHNNLSTIFDGSGDKQRYRAVLRASMVDAKFRFDKWNGGTRSVLSPRLARSWLDVPNILREKKHDCLFPNLDGLKIYHKGNMCAN